MDLQDPGRLAKDLPDELDVGLSLLLDLSTCPGLDPLGAGFVPCSDEGGELGGVVHGAVVEDDQRRSDCTRG